MKTRHYIIIGVLGLFVSVFYFTFRTTGCKLGMPSHLTIATVKYGDFVEWIPQTGTIDRDTVIVPIDEMYLPRISKGLKATTSLNDKEFQLLVTYIYPKIANGRFQVAMKFTGEAPKIPVDQNYLRLRIQLSEPSKELLLPMGDFYFHTGGKWIFVLRGNQAIKHEIKLGRRMGSEYFEVKEGLKAGDQVIASSYELFKDRDAIALSEVKNLYEGN